MKSKVVRGAARAAARRWGQLSFAKLLHDLPASQHACLRLPLLTKCEKTRAMVTLQLASDSAALMQWCALEYFGFLQGDDGTGVAPKKEDNDDKKKEEEEALLLGTSEVHLVTGAPRRLGYPASIEHEVGNYTEAVFAAEARAMESFSPFIQPDRRNPRDPLSDVTLDDNEGTSVPHLPPVRWLSQPLLDGFVARRVHAHSGALTDDVVAAQAVAAPLLAPHERVPPYAVSPYYAADRMLSRWALFGEPALLVPQDSEAKEGQGSDEGAASHLRRALELALMSALLPSYRGLWLRAAALSNARTGDVVLLLGPHRSGKTTLALHCLAAAAAAANTSSSSGGGGARVDVRLTASESVMLAPGMPVAAALRRSTLDVEHDARRGPLVFCAAMPSSVSVGLGALLGTLRPNPSLVAHVQPALLQPGTVRALLRNTDGVLWDMSQRYDVHLREWLPHCAAPCQPAVLGTLRGVVLLDWNVDELYRGGPVAVRSHAARMPLGGADAMRCLRGLGARGGLARNHFLIRAVCPDEDETLRQLRDMLGDKSDAALVSMQGSVDFDKAVDTILELLA